MGAVISTLILIVGIGWALKTFWIAGMDFPCTICGTGTVPQIRALSEASFLMTDSPPGTIKTRKHHFEI